MSEQNVLAFVGKATGDKSLASKVKALPTRNLTGLIFLAQSEGFAFTADEWQAVNATAFGGELDDKALDQVTGGAGALVPCNGTVVFECNGIFPFSIDKMLIKFFN